MGSSTFRGLDTKYAETCVNLPNVSNFLTSKVTNQNPDLVRDMSKGEKTNGVPEGSSASLGFNLLWTTKIPN